MVHRQRSTDLPQFVLLGSVLGLLGRNADKE